MKRSEMLLCVAGCGLTTLVLAGFGGVVLAQKSGKPAGAKESKRDGAPSATAASANVKTIANSIGMKLALIPAGEFDMGSPASENGHQKEESPVHRVRITKPFYLGAHEVTQGQYEKVMGENPSDFKGDPNRPVETVSWDEAVSFCEKLSALPAERSAGRQYRLPTEAEWEYACRGGKSTRFSFGDGESELANYAWYVSNSGEKSHPVGEKRPNGFGLYDMHGNVFEWCADWFDEGYYKTLTSPVDDPRGPAEGAFRVDRGGGHSGSLWFCRSADRDWSAAGDRGRNLGFRVLASSPSGGK